MAVVERLNEWAMKESTKKSKHMRLISDSEMNELVREVNPKFEGRVLIFFYSKDIVVQVEMVSKPIKVENECYYFRLLSLGNYVMPIL